MDDDYLTLTQATKIAPGRPHISSIWRWIRRGTLTRSGSRVHLRAVRAGGRMFTTHAWLDEYLTGVNDGDATHFEETLPQSSGGAAIQTPIGSRTRVQAEQAVKAAEKELKEAGIS